ncbi:hypothetical protein WJX84_000826 [Apatococcus fuscideae]|uniref:Uncharacterized protein n=1 Tax=Apatococcus fuscideae TaxID=2026836 RepID=A0AAW1TEX2_9CHLO
MQRSAGKEEKKLAQGLDQKLLHQHNAIQYHRKVLQAGGESAAAAWLQEAGSSPGPAPGISSSDGSSSDAGPASQGASPGYSGDVSASESDASDGSGKDQLKSITLPGSEDSSSNSNYEPELAIGSRVPDTPDTYVTNAGFVFVSSEGLDEAPAATDYSNMTNREVAHAIFGDRKPTPDNVYNIPYAWILGGAVFGSLLVLLVLSDWCGMNK